METTADSMAKKVSFLFALLALLPAGCHSPAPEAVSEAGYDVLIRHGHILDGTGNPWYAADIAIRGDRIAAIGPLEGVQAKRVIDASGLVVSPGFIDMLGQSEESLLIDHRSQSKLSQGITSEITGEGGSIAPQNELTLAPQKILLDHYHLSVDWHDLAGYFHRLESSGTPINLGTYVGAAQVREAVLGDVDRAPTQTDALYFMANENDLQYGLKQPWTSIGLDAGETSLDGPLFEPHTHPRAWGGMPRFLGHYTRDLQLLDLPQAVRKVTSLPAQREHLSSRGLLKPGFYADVTVFDPAAILDTATYENPNQISKGVEYVLVNGQREWDRGKLTGATGGRPLRRNERLAVLRTGQK